MVTPVANPGGHDETNTDHLLCYSDDKTTDLGVGAFGLVHGDCAAFVSPPTFQLGGVREDLPLMESKPTANPAMMRPTSIIPRL